MLEAVPGNTGRTDVSGDCWKRGLWRNCEPARTRKSGDGPSLRLRMRAPVVYPADGCVTIASPGKHGCRESIAVPEVAPATLRGLPGEEGAERVEKQCSQSAAHEGRGSGGPRGTSMGGCGRLPARRPRERRQIPPDAGPDAGRGRRFRSENETVQVDLVDVVAESLQYEFLVDDDYLVRSIRG